MARISYEELVAWIKQHPRYHQDFKKEVEADVALYISFATPKSVQVETDEMDISGDLTLVIDTEKDGTVVGLEIL